MERVSSRIEETAEEAGKKAYLAIISQSHNDDADRDTIAQRAEEEKQIVIDAKRDELFESHKKLFEAIDILSTLCEASNVAIY